METSKFSLLQLIRKMIFIIVLALLFVTLLFYLIIHESKFQQTYQSVIQRKYDHLMNTDERKIIIIGGSNAAFGIDAEYLEKMTGLKVVNLGLHAGFGNLFNTEIMKGNINSGDIILLGYEYTLYTDCFEKLGDVNLIQQAIDNRIDMYSIIPVRNYPDVVGNIFQFAKSKYQGDFNVSGTYSSFSFDENGNMILNRDTIFDAYESNKSQYGEISNSYLSVTEANIHYLIRLKEYVSDKGASIYFIAPPLLEDATTCESEEFRNYADTLEKQTGIAYISDPIDYIYPKEWMFDTIYHCNNEGESERTQQLFKDLQSVLH